MLYNSRRRFIKNTAVAGVGLGLSTSIYGNVKDLERVPEGKRVGMIGLDTGHSVAFTSSLNNPEAGNKYNVPMFSSFSLRYMDGIGSLESEIGKITGTDAFSPAHLEEHHPDLFWYGVHGVEILFSIMGTGCKSVQRTHTEGTDYVVGKWEDNRIGTYRGIRTGKGGYGATVFGEKGIKVLNNYQGYNPLLVKITEFFMTGNVPVRIEETLEIFAFMQAADASKRRGGEVIDIKSVIEDAKS